MTDIVAIGFQYTGGLTPMLNDVKLATNEVNKLDAAQAALKRTEEQAEKVAGRLAMSLREKNNILKATASGSQQAIQNAKLENLENRLLAQGINKELIPALLKVQKENLELEQSAKAVAQAQRTLRGSSQASTKELRKNSVRLGQAAIQFEQFTNQIQGGGNALLAFSQQSADLGIVLGAPLLGAFAGIAGALVSFVAPAFMDTTDAANELGKATENLNAVFKRTETGAFDLSQDILELSQVSRQLAELRIATAMAEAEKQFKSSGQALKDLVSDVDALEGLFGVGDANFQRFLTFFNDANLSVESLTKVLDDASSQSIVNSTSLGFLRDMVSEVEEEFKLGTEAAVSLSLAFAKIQAGTSPTIEEVETLSTVLTMSKNSSSDLSNSFRELLSSMFPQIEAFIEANSIINRNDDSIVKLTKSQQDLIDKLDPLNALTRDQVAEKYELNRILELGLITEEQYNTLLSESNRLFKERRSELDGTTKAQREANAAVKEANQLADQQDQALQNLLDTLDPIAAATRTYDQNFELLLQRFADTEDIKEFDRLVAQLDANFEKTLGGLNKVPVDKDLPKLLSDIEKGADRIGTAFQSTGNGIIDTFGEAISVLNDFGKQNEVLIKQQEKLDEQRVKYAGNAEKLLEIEIAQGQLNEQNVQNQLSGIGSLLGASKNLFDEQSKEREALHRAEMAFAVVEMAIAAQKAFANAKVAITSAFSAPFPLNFAAGAAMIGIMTSLLGGSFGSSATAPTVGPAGTGTILGDDSAQSDSISASQERFEDIQLDQLAELRGIHDGISDLSGAINVLTRNIISAGNLDGSFATGLGTSGQFDSGGFIAPIGAGIASAALASVTGGFAALSGGLSLVLTAALDAITGGFVSDLLDGLIGGLFGGKTTAEVQDAGIKFMTQNLSTILETGIVDAVQFANVKITEEGGLFGLLGDDVSYEQQTQALGEDFTRQLGAIIGSITDTLLEAGDVLGITLVNFVDGTVKTLEDSLNEFQLSEIEISFQDKTGEEIEQELNALFSSVGDDLADFLFPSLRAYQQINEGMFETVLRVTKETVIFEDALEKLSITFQGGTFSAIPFGQAVIEASGGLDNFTDSFNSFYDAFFTEQEKLEDLTQSLSEIFESLGLAMPTTNEGFRNLVQEVALMGEAGAETLATLLQISPAMESLIEQLEDLGEISRRNSTFINDFNTFFRSLSSYVDLFSTISVSNTTALDQETVNNLIEFFGDSSGVIQAVKGFVNNFGTIEDSLNTTMVSLQVAFSDIARDIRIGGGDFTDSLLGAFDLSTLLKGMEGISSMDEENLSDTVKSVIADGKVSAQELRDAYTQIFQDLTNADISSGLFEQILALQGPLNEYISALEAQEQALESATNTLNNREMDMMIQLLELQGKSSEALSLTRSRELEELQKIDEANRELGLQSNLADLQAAIFLQEDYNKALEDSKTATSAAYDALNEAVTAQVSVLTDLVNELESQRNRIQSALRQQDVTTFGGFDLAMKELQEVLAAVTDGNLSANDLERVSALDLSTLTAGDTSGFSSLAEFTLSQAKVTNSLRELDSVLESAESAEQAKIDALNAELSAAKDQRDALLGIQEATLDLTDLEGEIASRDEVFQTEAERLADLQLAELEGLLTEEEQQRLNQALEDAIGTLLTQISTLDTSGLADIFVEITQLSQAVNEIPSGLTDSFNSLKSSIDLIPEKMDEIWSQKQDSMQEHVSFMETWKDSQIILLQDILNNLVQSGGSDTPVFDSLGIISELQTLNSTLRELTSNQWNQNRNTLPRIVDATEYLRDSLINDDRRKVSLPNSHYSNQLGILSAIQDLVISPIEDLPSSTTPDYSGLIVELQRIANATEYLRDSLFNDDRRKVSLPNSHYKGLFAIQDATEYLRDSLINDDRRKVSLPNSHYKGLFAIQDATEYLRDSLINDDRRKVSLPNSHYKGLFAIQDATEYLRDSLINDDRRKVSLPNSHYKLLTRNADASEYLVNSLINDDRRKVSLPNSHYNNQTEIIEELKSLRAEINDMAATQESIGKANLSANRKTSEINQRFEINGIDTNTSTT